MTRGVGGHSPANLQKYLHGVDYPADKRALLERARKNQAPEAIMQTIQQFPEQEYGGPQEVMKSYGQVQ